MLRGAEREHALLGTTLLLVAPAAAECGIEAVQVERLAQRLGQHDVGVGGAMRPGLHAGAGPRLVGMDEQLHTEALRRRVAELDHLAEIPAAGDLEQRERRLRRRKGLQRQVQHHRAVLADGIQHHRPFALRNDFPEDVDALGLQALQVGQRAAHST